MSGNKVDERIVEMRFDNKQFEDGVKTSVKSLDNLKKGLELEGASKGLSNLEKAGKSFSLNSIGESVDYIASKFSAFSVIGITALANLTNSAINTGKTLIKSLTIDPIKTGLDEYETKMNAIQTILTNTASKGTTIEDVNKVLNELNEYADKTIYNFSEMTRNIGTFTAAGVDLKTSATAIKGIANLAAGSGSNAQQASTAMYQLSQALASGSVKLQDWNSVVNAGMGGELFQKALEKTAKELGHGRDMSVSFRESLESGWITTKVLTKTLEKFASDKMLLQAATQVKTFTQLMDTMRESVQSGWAQTWEIIIGNKDEAAKMFTSINDVFGSMIGKTADARNEMLNFWKTNGGRDAMIQGITNAFKGLQAILKPIGEAFREVFPAITGKNLVDLSNRFKELTSKFKMEESTINNLKATFKGLFAVLDIGKQVIITATGIIGKLFGNISPAGDGILSFTAYIGNMLVSLDELIKKSGIVSIAIESVGNFIESLVLGIRNVVGTVSDAVNSFGNVDMSGLDTFSDKIKTRFEPFTVIGNLVKGVLYGIAKTVEKIAPVVFSLASAIGKVVGKIADNISSAINNADYSNMLDIINGGLFAGILIGLKKLIGSLTSIVDESGGFLSSVKEILDGVKGSLEAYQSSLKAKTLLSIAGAIAILAGGIFLLSTIDSEKLTYALAAMTAMFVELFASMSVFDSIMSSKGFKSMSVMTIGLIGLSVAIVILSSAMVKLSKIDWDGIYRGLIGIAGLSLILVNTAKALSANKTKGLITTALGLILFAVAVDILTSSVKKLGELDGEALTKGLIGVGVLVSELALFMKITDLSGMGILKGIGLIALATSLLILSSAVKKISEIDTGKLIKGLTGISVMLGQIVIFTKLLGNPKGLISTAIGLTIVGASMLIFASAIEKMGAIPTDTIIKGLLTMANALVIIVLALKSMPEDIIGKTVGLLILSGALVILSKALSNMGGMSWEEMARGLITLAGSLIIISGAMSIMKTGLSGAAAMIVMATALAILTPCIVALGKMSMGEIGKGLLALAGAFTIIGVAGLLLSPLIPVILGVSGAIALFGLGCLAVGAGILAFSAGISALAVAGTAGAAALVLAITSIVGLIPFILKTLATGLIDFVKTIADGIPVIVEAFIKIVDAIVNAATISIPKMVDSGIKLIFGIINGIRDNIRKVVEAGIDIIVNFIMGVTSKLPAIIDAAFKLIITFINGMADAIDSNHKALYDACGKFITSIVNAVVDLIPSLEDVGKNIISGLIKGMKSMDNLIKKAADGLVSGAINTAKSVLGIHSPSRVFGEIGMYSSLGFANGLKDFAGVVSNEAANVGYGAMDSLRIAMTSASSVISDSIDSSPTIRPVLDLTNVTSGANAINSLLNANQGLTVSNANAKAASIVKGMYREPVEVQNGSVISPKTDHTPVTKPLTLQLVLQNGKAIAEFIVDDLDHLMGNKNNIMSRAVGV